MESKPGDKEIQEQYIHLILRNRELTEDFLESSLDIDHFDDQYRMILHAIIKSHDNGVMLTEKSFTSYVSEYIPNKNQIANQEILYSRIRHLPANDNDYPMLKSKILKNFLWNTSAGYIKDFTKKRDDQGELPAIEFLAEKMRYLVDNASVKSNIIYENLNVLSEDIWQKMLDVRAGKIKEDFVSYGIKELDKASKVALLPGSLTLFCADVGGFKSTMMLNVAADVWWEQNENVLFVPLEMDREQIHYKLQSRQSGIPSNYISSPKSLQDDQMGKLNKMVNEEWKNHDSSFFILDAEERTRVSIIKREIKKHIDIFQPRLVVIDYIANLIPDLARNDRNDLEIGDMLKDLRQMGRPGVLCDRGFAIVSGAQVGREALKRVRKSTDSKISFNSEDLRGSQEFSADADNIFVLFKDPQQPDERLQIFAVKCRYGDGVFPEGGKKALLEVQAGISMIRSSSEYYNGANAGDILQKMDDEDLDIEDAEIEKSQVPDIDDIF